MGMIWAFGRSTPTPTTPSLADQPDAPRHHIPVRHEAPVAMEAGTLPKRVQAGPSEQESSVPRKVDVSTENTGWLP